jgi:plastocyanin
MKKNYFVFAAFIALSIAIGSCTKNTAAGGGGTPPVIGFATDSISLSGLRYSPQVDTVHVGHAIKWQNNDGVTHTATSDDAGVTFNTGNIAAGTFATYTPTATGTITYHCIYHGSMGMTGTLIVKP